MSKTNKYIIISGAFLLAVMLMSSPVFADPLVQVRTDKYRGIHQVNIKNKSLHRRIIGQITSIDGNILSLKDKKNVIYSVDVSNAKIMKTGSAIILADVRVGDTVAVVGVISGQNINATRINDIVLNDTQVISDHFSGVVTSIAGSSFVINSNGWQTSTTTVLTVNTDSHTIFGKTGKGGNINDVAVGQIIVIKGVRDTNSGIVMASSVRIMVKHFPFKHILGN